MCELTSAWGSVLALGVRIVLQVVQLQAFVCGVSTIAVLAGRHVRVGEVRVVSVGSFGSAVVVVRGVVGEVGGLGGHARMDGHRDGCRSRHRGDGLAVGGA